MKYIKTFESKKLTQKEFDSELLKHSYTKSSLNYIRELVSSGADINCTDNYGNTPLMISSQVFFYSAAKLFIENGADINIVNRNGENCLTRLLMVGKYTLHTKIDQIKATIDLLIENGCELYSITNSGSDIFEKSDDIIKKYIIEKFPNEYEKYLLKKNSKKYNL